MRYNIETFGQLRKSGVLADRAPPEPAAASDQLPEIGAVDFLETLRPLLLAVQDGEDLDPLPVEHGVGDDIRCA